MKKYRGLRFWAAMLVMLALMGFAAGASALTNSTYSLEYETFTADDGTTQVKITGVTSQTKTSYTVPATLGGYPVTQIGYGAFKDCTVATSVTLPSSVNTLSTYSFAYMDALKTINIPEGVTAIPESCFYGSFYDSDAEITITLPSTVTSIGSNAFTATYVDHYYLPDSLTGFTLSVFGSWGSPVFHCTVGSPVSLRLGELDKQFLDGETEYKFLTDTDGNISLQLRALPASLNTSTSYTVPDNIAGYPVTSLYSTFSGWTALETVKLPDSVTEFAGYVFQNCAALEAVELPAALEIMGNSTFSGCSSLKNFTIPDSVTELGTSVFANCTSLTAMDVSGVAEVSGLYGMFSGCTSLQSVQIPDSLTGISTNAFNNCKKLTSINVPSGLISVGAGAFEYCRSLTSFAFPRTLKTIEEDAFGSVPLENVRIPASVTKIGSYALNSVAFSEFMLPEGLTYLGKYVFAGAENVPEYIILPESLTTLLAHAICYNNEGYTFAVLEGSEQETKVQSLGGDYVYYQKTQIGTDSYYSYFVHDAAGKLLFFDRTSGIYTSRTIIPDGITAIADGVFENSWDLNDAFVVFPEGLTAIGANAFAGTTVRKLSFPQSLTSIGAGAFSGIEESERIILSAKITSIGEGAFPASTLLLVESGSAGETFAVENGNPYGVDQNGFALSPDGKTLYNYTGSDADVVIPDGVEVIDGAFSGNTAVASVTMPDSVRHLASDGSRWTYGAFYGCTALKQMTMNDGLASIGKQTFYGCTVLESALIPQGVTAIGEEAFANCTGMTEIEIPDSVTEIGAGAFSRCYSLKRIELPSGLTTISRDLFMDTEPEYIGIPAGVTTIEEGAFQMCYVPALYLPSGITSVAAWTAETTGSFEDQTLYCAPGSTTAQTLEAAGFSYTSNVEQDGYLTIQTVMNKDGELVRVVTDCDAAATDVVIPDDVVEIGDYAFDGCSAMTMVTIPESVTRIGEGAFSSCSSLMMLEIPENVTTIGGDAFGGCYALADVIVRSDTLDLANAGLTESCMLYGYAGTAAQAFAQSGGCAGYRTLDAVTNLIAYSPDGTRAELAWDAVEGASYEVWGKQYSLAQGLLATVTEPAYVQNTMYGETFRVRPAYQLSSGTIYGDYADVTVTYPEFAINASGVLVKYGGEGGHVVIPDGVTAIGSKAFYGQSAVTGVTIPEGVTSIGVNAFYGTKLTALTLPDSVTTIGDYAFQYTPITTLELGSGVRKIGAHAFRNTQLTTADLGESLTTIGDYAFAYCAQLASVTLPDSVTSIGECAFYKNTSLTGIDFPARLTTLGNHAFAESTKFTTANLPDGVKGENFGNYVFLNCPLETVTIPAGMGITTIGAIVYNPYNVKTLTVYDENINISWLLQNSYGATVYASTTSRAYQDYQNYGAAQSHTFVPLEDFNLRVETAAEPLELLWDLPEGVHGVEIYRLNEQTGAYELVGQRAGSSTTDYGTKGGHKYTYKMRSYTIQTGGIYAYGPMSAAMTVATPGYDDCTITYDSFYGYRLTGYTGSESVLFIPDHVQQVYDYALKGNTVITKVILPESMEKLNYYCFAECPNLTEVVIPPTLKTIGDSAFRNCDIRSLTLPEGVEQLSYYAFSGNKNLTEVSLPQSLTHIAGDAFSYCESLESIDLPDALTWIGGGAFRECTSLRSIELPDSITGSNLADYAFQGCTSLETVKLPANLTALCNWEFEGCTSLTSLILPASLSEMWTEPLEGCASLADLVILNRGIVLDDEKIEPVAGRTVYGYIGSTAETYAAGHGYAFVALDAPTGIDAYSEGGSKVTVSWFAMGEVTGYEVYGADAADGEFALVGETTGTELLVETDAHAYYKIRPYVDVPSGRAYGEFTAAAETYVVEYEIVNGVLVRMYLDQTEVVVPDGVTAISDSAFAGNANTQHIVLPDTVTSIGAKAFEGCAALTSVNIPDGVTSIGAHAFDGCTALARVILPDNVTAIGENAFGTTVPVCRADTDTLAAILELGCDYTKIEGGLHLLWQNETFTITGCEPEMESVVIPENVTIIAPGAFAGCEALTSLYIPENVVQIGEDAFMGCTALAEIAVMNRTAIVGSNAFSTGTAGRVIGYPDGGADEAAASAGYAFCSLAFEGSLSAAWESAVVLTWTADENALRTEIWRAPHGGEFEKIAETTDASYTDAISDYNSAYKLRRAYAFAGEVIMGDFSAAASVSVPMFTVNAAGTLTAYTGTDSDVLIPANVKQIAGGVFRRKTAIASVTMVSGLESIGASAFEQCTALASVTLSDTLTTIGDKAFYNCVSLASVTLPDNVSSIGVDVFASGTVIRCTPGSTTAEALTAAGYEWRCAGAHETIIRAAVPATHKTTGLTQGETCTACGLIITAQQEIPMLDLDVMALPAFLTTIGEEAFAGSAAEAVELPDGAAAIGNRAFANCAALQVIEIPASVTYIAPDAFESCRDDLVILTTRGSTAYTFARENGMQVVTNNPEAGDAITLESVDGEVVSVYSDAAMTVLKASHASGTQAMLLQYGVSSCMIYIDGSVAYVATENVR